MVGRGESFFENSQDYRTLRNIDQHLDWESAPWAETFVGGTQGNAARNLALRPAGLWGTPPPESPPVGGPAGWWILGAMVVMGVLKAMEQNPLVDPRRAIMPDTGIRVTDELAPAGEPVMAEGSADKTEFDQAIEEGDTKVRKAKRDLDNILAMRDEDVLSVAIVLSGIIERLAQYQRTLQEKIAEGGSRTGAFRYLERRAGFHQKICRLEMELLHAQNDSVEEEVAWFRAVGQLRTEVEQYFGEGAPDTVSILHGLGQLQAIYEEWAEQRPVNPSEQRPSFWVMRLWLAMERLMQQTDPVSGNFEEAVRGIDDFLGELDQAMASVADERHRLELMKIREQGEVVRGIPAQTLVALRRRSKTWKGDQDWFAEMERLEKMAVRVFGAGTDPTGVVLRQHRDLEQTYFDVVASDYERRLVDEVTPEDLFRIQQLARLATDSGYSADRLLGVLAAVHSPSSPPN